MPGLRPSFWRPERPWRLRPNNYKAGRTHPAIAKREECFSKAMYQMLKRMDIISLLGIEKKVRSYASCVGPDLSSPDRDGDSVIKAISRIHESLSSGDRGAFERFLAFERFIAGARSRAEGRAATAGDGGAGQPLAEGHNPERAPAEDGGARQPPAEDGGARRPPAEDSGAGRLPAEDSGAGRLPAEDGGAGRPPAEDSGAGRPPAEDGGAGRPPAEDGGAGRPPAEDGGAGRPHAEDGGAGRRTVTTTEDGGAGRPSPTIVGRPWAVASTMLAAAAPGGEIFPTVEAVESGMKGGERPPTPISPAVRGKIRRRGKGKGKGKGKGRRKK